MTHNPVFRQVIMAVAMLVLVSCQSAEPVRIGFVGGLSGKAADLGGAGRNGALLAVEQRNAAGGIDGRPVELVIQDDRQDPDTARRAVAELLEENIEIIIGPMTSSMAMAMLPLIDASEGVLLSPTATTTDLSGRDDNFLRVISSTTDYASKSARYQFEKMGTRSVAAIYDENNKSYTESWLKDFQATFEGLGGKVIMQKYFRSADGPVYHQLAMELAAVNADALLIVGNAVDAAMLCQQYHAIALHKRIFAAEWAATERFVELAGAAAEGVAISQFFDRNDTRSSYVKFVGAYRKRFQQEPGFAGLAGYDAAMVALEAYAARRKGVSMKDTILGLKRFQGVQQQIEFDRFGDAERETFTTVVRNGTYHTLE